jgi:hypothetical protein
MFGQAGKKDPKGQKEQNSLEFMPLRDSGSTSAEAKP